MNETFVLFDNLVLNYNISVVLVILLVYELVYFNIMDLVSWIIIIFFNFLCEVDS